MTAHVTPSWSFGDDLTADMVQHMVACIEANKQGDKWQPPVFGTFSHGDKIIFLVAMLLDHYGEQQITRKMLEEHLPIDGDEAEAMPREEADKIEAGRQAVIRVLQHMDRWKEDADGDESA